jgi:hypothetical protein
MMGVIEGILESVSLCNVELVSYFVFAPSFDKIYE